MGGYPCCCPFCTKNITPCTSIDLTDVAYDTLYGTISYPGCVLDGLVLEFNRYATFYWGLNETSRLALVALNFSAFASSDPPGAIDIRFDCSNGTFPAAGWYLTVNPQSIPSGSYCRLDNTNSIDVISYTCSPLSITTQFQPNSIPFGLPCIGCTGGTATMVITP